MKKLLFLGLAIVLSLTACQKQEKRYTQQSPEIDTYKKVIEASEKQDWETMATYYADSAKIMNNEVEAEGKTIAESMAINKADASLFSTWDYVDAEAEYEMVVTDKGETWVNFYGVWKGTLIANNEVYTIPSHITAQFVNGKIIKEFGYWDVSKIVSDIDAIQDAEKSSVAETEKTESATPDKERAH